MIYDPNVHHRRSVRLRAYNYSQRGAYFVTLCTHGRLPWFGEIEEDADGAVEVRLSPCGILIQEEWLRISERLDVELDDFVVMPNHLHAVLVLPGAAVWLAQAVGSYKSLTALAYGRKVRDEGWPPYERRFWHRNYHEHVIRDQADLDRIRLYIANNPARWAEDDLNPANRPRLP